MIARCSTAVAAATQIDTQQHHSATTANPTKNAICKSAWMNCHSNSSTNRATTPDIAADEV